MPKENTLLEKDKCHFFEQSGLDGHLSLVLFPNGKYLNYHESTWDSIPPKVFDRGTWKVENKHILLISTIRRNDIRVENMGITGSIFREREKIEKLETAISNFLSENKNIFFSYDEVQNIYKIRRYDNQYISGIEYYGDKNNEIKRDQLLKLLNAITDSKNTTQVSLPPMVPVLCKEEEYIFDSKLLKDISKDGVRCNYLATLGYKKLKNYKICENTEETPIYLEVCEKCNK